MSEYNDIVELSDDQIDDVNGGNPLLIAVAVVVVVVVGAAFVAGVIDGASGSKKQTD